MRVWTFSELSTNLLLLLPTGSPTLILSPSKRQTLLRDFYRSSPSEPDLWWEPSATLFHLQKNRRWELKGKTYKFISVAYADVKFWEIGTSDKTATTSPNHHYHCQHPHWSSSVSMLIFLPFLDLIDGLLRSTRQLTRRLLINSMRR
jgi:hypothetical protein